MRALHVSLGLALGAGLLIFGTAFGASDDDAFLIEKRDFKKQYRTIALAPAEADPYLNMPESVAGILEEEVTARLTQRGYTVIPSSVLAGIRKTMEEQVGGIKDPESGRTDVEKAQAVRSHAFRELWFRHQFDALATIRVSITQVAMENDRVEWDGARQKLEYEGRSKDYSATVSVSSVALALSDASEKPLYLCYGGLEPLMYRADDQLQPLQVEVFFRDEERIRKAAQIVVDPF